MTTWLPSWYNSFEHGTSHWSVDDSKTYASISFAWDSNCIARSRELYIPYMILDMDRPVFFAKVNSPKSPFVRKGRCTALKRTELLIFHRDDYKWQHDWIMVHGWCCNHVAFVAGSYVAWWLLFCNNFRYPTLMMQKFSGALELHKRLLWKSVWLSCEWPRKVTMQKHGEVDKSLLGDMAWIGFMPF